MKNLLVIRLINKTRAKAKVTVGFCVRNSEQTVKEAINRIINQTYPSELMEIIVVDGNSKDKTLSIVTDILSKTDIQTKIYSDEGIGLGYARQMVVDYAEGKYIVFVDGDVELLNDFVQEQVDFMEQDSKIGVAVGKYMFREANLIATLQNLNCYLLCDQLANKDETISHGINYGTSIYRAKALRQVGGFDKKIKGAGEDADIMARIKAKGWGLSINKKAIYYHKPRDNFGAFWLEQKWFGYGDHYFRHKHSNIPFILWRRIPIITFAGNLKIAVEAYKSVHQKKSFLMPLLFSLGTISWWLGFAKSNLDGYGHEAN